MVPIFAPFNYRHGYIWGTETAVTYNADNLSIHASTTIGRNMQKGVATGQFNFDPDELGYIRPTLYRARSSAALRGLGRRLPIAGSSYAFSVDALYSSGLRAGFADLESLPHFVQVDLSGQRTFRFAAHRRSYRPNHTAQHLRSDKSDQTCRGYRDLPSRLWSENYGL